VVLVRSHVAECLDAEERHHPTGSARASPEPRSGPTFGTASQRGTDRPGAAEHPTGTGLAGPRLSA
jgi:hypothetical protein